MSYRDFVRPEMAEGRASAADWIGWMDTNGILVPTAPRPASSCRYCAGAVTADKNGRLWPRCYVCKNSYSAHLERLVSVTYSTPSGLESMLHRYKDWNDYRWMSAPLGALLYTFLRSHLSCLSTASGGIDVATTVPSNSQSRPFDHLADIVNSGSGSPIRPLLNWDLGVITRDPAASRPGRAEISPAAYSIDAPIVAGKNVLLFDDVWTSGASMGSCANALKEAGAQHVIGLTLGRQLPLDRQYGSTDRIEAELRGRRWSASECVICSR